MQTTSTATLIGITTGRAACDCCGRTLARVFRVMVAGTERHYGRVCAAKATGYNWSIAQAESAARRIAADKIAAETYGDLWTRALAARDACNARTGMAGVAGEALGLMRSGGDAQIVRAWISKAEVAA